MTVVNTKSTIVTKADANRIVPAYLSGGLMYAAAAAVEVAAADDDGSVYRMFRVHSSWRIVSLELFNDAITGGTTYDLGLCETQANGGAIVSGQQELFGSDISMATARTAPLDVTYEALDVAKVEKRLWELLGLTADPGKEYDIAWIASTVGTAGGTISMRMRWVQDI